MKTTTVAPVDTCFVLHSVSLQLFVTFLCSTAALSVLLILYIFYVYLCLFYSSSISFSYQLNTDLQYKIIFKCYFFSHTYGTIQLHDTWDGVLTENKSLVPTKNNFSTC